MAFIHKNVNSALLTLIAFISVALVTATVYSVNAFDSINNAYVEQAIRADSLEAELAQKSAMTDALKQTAQLTQDREAALADMLAKEREAAAQATVAESASSTTANVAKATTAKATTPKVYNPYANRYTYWPYRTTKLVI
jgi:hypothetical protein